MKGLKFTMLVLAIVAALVACEQQNDNTSAPDDTSTSTAGDPAQTEAAPDPRAINEAIPSDQFAVKLSQAGDPQVSLDGSSVNIPIRVANAGTYAIYGVGEMPVNLGVQVLGDGDTVTGVGGEREFVRVPLPYIAGGSEATVNVIVPWDPRLKARKIRIALVQEGSSWYESSEYGPIDLGPFPLCEERFCNEAGALVEH